MSGVKHTPGPWHVGNDFEAGIGRGWFVSGSGFVRANMVGPVDACEANARLIAAAPDLLDALREALHEINEEIEQRKCSGNDEYWAALQAIWERGDAAIRKAEGRA